jgi:hypothetical protein
MFERCFCFSARPQIWETIFKIILLMEAEIQPKRYSLYKVPLFFTDGHKTYTVCRLCEEVKGVRFQENLYNGRRDKTATINCSPKMRF